MVPYFSIIQALCRSLASGNTEFGFHQVHRLAEAYRKDGNLEEADALEKIATSPSKQGLMNSCVITTSESTLCGEQLFPNTPLPVDKESSAPILEVIFPEKLPYAEPLFDDAIREAVGSVVTEWSHYDELVRMNATPSRSCLIYGSPGTGKTHLAKWIARQIGLPIVVARLDGIVSSFLGTSSRNISNLFAFANRYKCVLLLDEFDAIAKLRDDPQEIGEVKRIVNTLLQNLDKRDEIGFTIGITNHEQLLDPAIWRRFDVQIEIPKPSTKILPIILSDFLKPLTVQPAELLFLSWCLQGSSGADVQKLANWLKRMKILDEYKNYNILDLMKRYALLNTGRISDNVRTVLEQGMDEVYKVLKDTYPDLKQKDIASMFNISASSFNKKISKNS